MSKLNPFSTRFIQPGAIEYLEDELSVAELAQQLVNDRRVFQIVGPHGSGKTSLTIAIGKQLRNHSIGCDWITLRKSNFFAPPRIKREDYLQGGKRSGTERRVLFVDGIEVLGWLSRRLILRHLRSTNNQLVFTVHRRLSGYPVLATIEPRLEVFRKLALQLHPSSDPDWHAQVDQAFEVTSGNIREAFFQLYDHCR